MSSQTGLTSGMLFQSINEDLNASLATADELSREFSSLLQEASTSGTSQAASQTTSLIPREKPQSMGSSSFPSSSTATSSTREGSGRAASSVPYSPSPASQHSLDTILSGAKTPSPSSVSSFQSLSSPQPRQDSHSPLPRLGSDSFLYSQQSPEQSPRPQRCDSPIRYNRSPRGSLSYMERSPSPSPTTAPFDQPVHSNQLHPSSGMLSPYDAGQTGRRSPRHERSPSPRHFSHSMASTLPRNFGGFKQTEERSQHQKGPGKWNETDLDASFDRKPHHTYDKTDWIRPSVPNSSWRESNLDGPPPAPSPKKDSLFGSHQPVHGSLPRNARISVPPDKASLAQPPYHPQPIISRISIPPLSPRPRQRQPIPLSVIMRLQNPRWDAGSLRPPRVLGKEGDRLPYLPVAPQPRESLPKPQFQPQPPELRQPAFYSEVLNSGDVDAELEKLDLVHHLPAILEAPGTPERGGEDPGGPAVAPRPLSPTRLQPVVAPEAQNQEIPDLEELLRIRAEIPRALKRRGSVDQALPLKKASHYEPNQYKHLINKLFRRKAIRHKGEQGSENSSSSEGEDFCSPPPLAVTTVPSTPAVHDYRNYHSILRRSRERKESGRRARLSPLVLLLDGSLVGELETVQRAVQEMIDPSQPNDEGITALHNAICGGHYNVVEFLVRIGANVSAPDSHGWTPLHCSASCNDRPLCEFLVRNGAAVMAVTESDGASASQKCDPYAAGFEECESFLRGVEEAMGVENSGVLYALWSYPAQAVDELSFREGDMVTILQKPEGVDWWWASLCGREGFVPNNYFGLFPKVRPKSLC